MNAYLLTYTYRMWKFLSTDYVNRDDLTKIN